MRILAFIIRFPWEEDSLNTPSYFHSYITMIPWKNACAFNCTNLYIFFSYPEMFCTMFGCNWPISTLPQETDNRKILIKKCHLSFTLKWANISYMLVVTRYFIIFYFIFHWRIVNTSSSCDSRQKHIQPLFTFFWLRVLSGVELVKDWRQLVGDVAVEWRGTATACLTRFTGGS